MIRSLRRPAACVLFCLPCMVVISSSSVGEAATVSLSPSKDNTLYENASGALSNGAGNRLFSGVTGQSRKVRGLIAFDIASAIPAGSTIESVELELDAILPTMAGTRDISLHQLTQDWGEGTSVGEQANGNGGGGAPSTTGDATWIHTFFNTNTWNTPGGDFEAAPSATQTVRFVGLQTWGSTDALVADVQGWLDNPATNFGWTLLGDESTDRTAWAFASREHPTAQQPTLRVTFTAVPEPASLALLTLIAPIAARRKRR